LKPATYRTRGTASRNDGEGESKLTSDSLDIEITVNGVRCRGKCEPRKLLADFLREDLALTGTHVGCEHGICGACTILFNGEAVRSCIMFAVQANGGEIGTVEGLAKDGRLHPLQQAFHECHALQCGFCTPGMLIMAVDFLRVNSSPTRDEIREAVSAVICRCTGYRNIVDAIDVAAKKMRSQSETHQAVRALACQDVSTKCVDRSAERG
jgi:aerobic-type carbon monoxide dehydrogenase small subunit (CoxS/CutS family)